MPGAPVDIGTGTQITFTTSGFVAQVIETLDWSTVQRGAVQTSHMLTPLATAGTFGGHTFIPTKHANPGRINLVVHFSPDDEVPLHAPPEQIKVTFPLVANDATAALWQAEGFIVEMSPSIPYEDKMVNRIAIQLSGLVDMTPAT